MVWPHVTIWRNVQCYVPTCQQVLVVTFLSIYNDIYSDINNWVQKYYNITHNDNKWNIFSNSYWASWQLFHFFHWMRRCPLQRDVIVTNNWRIRHPLFVTSWWYMRRRFKNRIIELKSTFVIRKPTFSNCLRKRRWVIQRTTNWEQGIGVFCPSFMNARWKSLANFTWDRHS